MPLDNFSGVDFLSLVSGFDFRLLGSVGLGLGASVFEACFGASLGFVVAGSFIELLMRSGLGFCDFSLGASDFLEGFAGFSCAGLYLESDTSKKS